MPANVAGAYNLFEAARRQGVKRIIVASSNHAVGFFPRNQTIDDSVLPRPDGRYGLSKAFNEMLGRLYADKYGMEVFCIRIGAMTPEPEDVRRLAIWIHPEDLTSLVELGISASNIRYEIVYGMSNNKRAWWDNGNALRLGYRPKHQSEQFAQAVIAREPPHDPNDPTQVYQGGAFVTAESVVHRKYETEAGQ
jgi:uronate dehydrogenase